MSLYGDMGDILDICVSGFPLFKLQYPQGTLDEKATVHEDDDLDSLDEAVSCDIIQLDNAKL